MVVTVVCCAVSAERLMRPIVHAQLQLENARQYRAVRGVEMIC